MSYDGRTDPENKPQTVTNIILMLAFCTVCFLAGYGAVCLITKLF